MQIKKTDCGQAQISDYRPGILMEILGGVTDGLLQRALNIVESLTLFHHYRSPRAIWFN
jgi:hypothetical protein